MSSQRHRELIAIWYHRMWNQWDASVIPEILCPDIAFRGSLGNVVEGHEGVRGYVNFIRAAFPDFHNEIEEIIAEGNKAFARLTYSGTHRGEIFGIQPAGRRFSYAGAAVFTFRDGRIGDVWVLGDVHGLLRQLEGQADAP